MPTALSLVLPDGYGFILLEIIGLCIILVSQSVAVSQLREKLFTKEFFDKHFPQLKPHPKNGYPDTGEGRFADKLTVDEWIKFNSAQRAHMNMVEGFTSTIIGILIAGLSYPRFTAICTPIYGIGRLIYGYGYRSGGPAGRRVGGYIQAIGGTPILLASIVSAWTIMGGVEGFHKFITS
jgi:glutathione S-transferase